MGERVRQEIDHVLRRQEDKKSSQQQERERREREERRQQQAREREERVRQQEARQRAEREQEERVRQQLIQRRAYRGRQEELRRREEEESQRELKTQRHNKVIFVLLLLIVAGGITYYFFNLSPPEPPPPTAPAVVPPPATPTPTATATPTPIPIAMPIPTATPELERQIKTLCDGDKDKTDFSQLDGLVIVDLLNTLLNEGMLDPNNPGSHMREAARYWEESCQWDYLLTPTLTATPTPTPILTAAEISNLRQYALGLINKDRADHGLPPVQLGQNIAAQLHAEASLENCFSSHWGMDGLKPYMRYSLAGGYQSNGENAYGSDYCIKPHENYLPLESIKQEIEDAMKSLMDSPGHRRNILDPTHKKVNIGLAWDRFNIVAYQHFEGDYVEYDSLPTIEGTVLSISGRVKNGVRFSGVSDLSVQVYYDPPFHPLTRGQLSRTYCYDNGRPVASLRWPLYSGAYWPTHEYTTTHEPCPSPYDVSPEARAPSSPFEAHEFWLNAYGASLEMEPEFITVPWITALAWNAVGTDFSVKADMGSLPAGVYTVMLWAPLGGELIVISQYSIFHEVTPPDTYYE